MASYLVSLLMIIQGSDRKTSTLRIAVSRLKTSESVGNSFINFNTNRELSPNKKVIENLKWNQPTYTTEV